MYIKIDGILVRKIVNFNDKIWGIFKLIDFLYDFCVVRFNGLEKNVCVIRVIGFINDLDNYLRVYD